MSDRSPAYGLSAIDWYLPVLDVPLMDGIFADWVFYSFVSLVILAVPLALFVKRHA